MTADVESTESWAARLAAGLPPMTESEAAIVGQIAAAIDSRRASAAVFEGRVAS